MSWTEYFPVVDDDLVDGVHEVALSSDLREIEAQFRPLEEAGRKRASSLLSMVIDSVHCFAIGGKDGASLATNGHLAYPADFAVELILKVRTITALLDQRGQGEVLRIYLGANLGEFTQDLALAGAEVFLMPEAPSRTGYLRLCKFLALNEGCPVTFGDFRKIELLEGDLERTRVMAMSQLGIWRIPRIEAEDDDLRMTYRPISDGRLGTVAYPGITELLVAFVWLLLKGELPRQVSMPGCGMRMLTWGQWGGGDIDDLFGAVMLFPRMAAEGVLTFVGAGTKSLWLPIDVEYVTWANAKSQLVFYNDEGCCGDEVPFSESLGSAAVESLQPVATDVNLPRSPEFIWIFGSITDPEGRQAADEAEFSRCFNLLMPGEPIMSLEDDTVLFLSRLASGSDPNDIISHEGRSQLSGNKLPWIIFVDGRVHLRRNLRYLFETAASCPEAQIITDMDRGKDLDKCCFIGLHASVFMRLATLEDKNLSIDQVLSGIRRLLHEPGLKAKRLESGEVVDIASDPDWDEVNKVAAYRIRDWSAEKRNAYRRAIMPPFQKPLWK